MSMENIKINFVLGTEKLKINKEDKRCNIIIISFGT
jgi:hypothetical protein